MLQKITNFLILLFLFLLPWQTRWIYDPNYINGEFWEYGSFSWYGTEILIWLIIILFSYRVFSGNAKEHLFGKIHFSAHKSNLLIAACLMVFFFVEIAFSKSFNLSYNYFIRVLEGLCIAGVIIASGIPQKRLITVFWSGAIVQGIIGSHQFFSQQIYSNRWLGMALQGPAVQGSSVIELSTERWLRAYGSFGSPNILGGFLAVAFLLGLILYLESRPWEKIYLTLGQSIILLGLILTFSRGAWIASLSGLFTLGVVLAFNARAGGLSKMHSFFLYIKQVVFYAALIIASALILEPLYATRLQGEARLEQKSISERKSQYKEAVDLISERPWLGTGPGAYTLSVSEKNPSARSYQVQPVHNSFILVLSEWGLFGVVVLEVFLILLFLKFKWINIYYLSVIITILISGLFDHFWVSLYSGQVILWVTMSLVLKSSLVDK